MTCNYKNSAGTDLDSLFSIDNSNGGAIGFKMSDGTDLGNRFTNKSTLGQTIGYKNSAGTDIGNLRGKVVAPSSISNWSSDLPGWANNCGCSTNYNVSYTTTCYDGESSYSCTEHPTACWRCYIGRVYFTVNQPITSARFEVQINPKYANNAGYWLADARLQNAYFSNPAWSDVYGNDSNKKTIALTKSYSNVTSGTEYIAFASGASRGENHFYVHVRAILSNSAGSVTTGWIWLGNDWYKAYW